MQSEERLTAPMNILDVKYETALARPLPSGHRSGRSGSKLKDCSKAAEPNKRRITRWAISP